MPLPLFAIGLAAKLSPVGRFLKSIPWQIWAAVALAGLIWWHLAADARNVRQARSEGYSAGVAAERAAAKAAADRLKAEIDAKSAEISRLAKEKNDAEVRAIAARADGLRLSGPGRAVCPGSAEVAGGPGRSEPGSGQGSPAGPDMFAGQWAAVPWGWLVGTAERCDLNRAEVLAWRDWWVKQSEAWEKASKSR